MSLVVRIVPDMQSMLSVVGSLAGHAPILVIAVGGGRHQGPAQSSHIVGGSKDEPPPFTFILELSPESSQELDKKIQRTPQHGCCLWSQLLEGHCGFVSTEIRKSNRFSLSLSLPSIMTCSPQSLLPQQLC